MPGTQADYDRAFGIRHVEVNGCVYVGVSGPEAWQMVNKTIDRYEARLAAMRVDRERAESLKEAGQ